MIKNNKGVTLVELLIVIVILGIIAAISIPAVGRIVENSRKDAFIADAVQLRNAAVTYCAQAEEENSLKYCSLSGDNDVLEFLDPITPADLGDFITSLSTDYTTAKAWLNDDGVWEVQLENNSTGFIYEGDPTAATRENINIEGNDFDPSWGS